MAATPAPQHQGDDAHAGLSQRDCDILAILDTMR